MSLFSTLAISGSGMAAESERLAAVASNIANANSIVTSAGAAYRAREVVFAAVSQNDDDEAPSAIGLAGVRVAAIVESADPLRTVHDPGNSFADADGYVTMPNVNPVEEMVNMISAQQNYQANLEAFNVAKTLALRTLTI